MQAVATTGTGPGTWTLAFNGQTTIGIAANASAGTVQTDLDNLSTIGGVNGNVTVTSGTTLFDITVKGASGDTFSLQFGNNITGSLDAGSNTLASDIQTALNKLQSIANVGGVTVQGLGGGVFAVTFQAPGADISQFSWNTIKNGSGNLNVTFSGPLATAYTIAFGGTLGDTNVPLLVATGGNGVTVSPVTVYQPANPFIGNGISKIIVDDNPFNGSNGATVLYVADGDQSANAAPYAGSLGAVQGKPGIWRLQSGTWFDMTAPVSGFRYGLTGQSPFTASTPNNPGPDDNYELTFPQSNTTWSDLTEVYTDITNTGVGTPQPVLYAALGPANGTLSLGGSDNRVYWTETPSNSQFPEWYVGDPGSSLFSDPRTFPASGDARDGNEFNAGNSAGNIKISAVAGITLVSTTVYASVSSTNGFLNGVYVTTSGGQKWAGVSTPPSDYMNGEGNYANAIYATSSQTVYVAGYEPIGSTTHAGIVYMSTSGGSSWNDVTVENGHGPHTGAHAFADNNNNLYLGTDGGLFQLNTSNTTWADVNGNLTISQVNSVASSPASLSTIYAGTQSDGVEEFNNNLAWSNVEGTNGAGQVIVDPSNANNVYAVNLPAGIPTNQVATVSHLVNGSWTTIYAAPSASATIALDTINDSRVLVSSAAGLLESLNGGANLSSNPINLFAPVRFTSIGLATYQGPFVADGNFPLVTDLGANTYDPNTIWGTDGFNVYYTKNGGLSWAQTAARIGTGPIYKIVVDPRNRDTVYAIVNDNFSNNQVYVTTDAGRSWTNISYNLPQLPAWSLVLDPRDGDLYIGLDQGVYKLPAGTTTWQQFGAGLPNVQVRDLQLNTATNALLAGTYGRGVYEIFLDDGLAGAGALRAVSGNSVWTGTVLLQPGAANGDVQIAANGTQAPGIATASLNIVGTITDVDATDPARLVKIGQGNITLSGTNNYNGVTEVRTGNLIINNPQALGSTAAGTVVDNLAALQLQSGVNGEPLTLNGSGPAQGFNGHSTGSLENLSNDNTYSGPITLNTDATIGVDSGSSLNVSGAIGGPFNLIKELTGTLILSGPNTYGGSGTFTVPTDPSARAWAPGTVVVQGALSIGAADGPGAAGNTTTVLDGAQLEMQGGVAVPNQNLRLSGTGISGTGAILNVSGDNTWEGTITLAQDAGFLPPTTPPNVVNFGVQYTTPADALDVTGQISQVAGIPIAINKVGPGVLILDNGNNNYQGQTVVSAGAIRVQADGSLGTTTNNAVVKTGAALEIDGDPTNVGNSITYTNKPLVLNGTGTPEVQQVSVAGLAGTFTLSFNGQATGSLAYNATAAQVQAALNALTSISTGGGSVGVTSYGNPEVQQVAVGGGSGTFTLSFNGKTTAPLPYNATATQVQTALNTLASTLGVGGSVTVTQSGNTYTVTFGAALGLGRQPLLTAATVTGSPNVTVSEVTQGTLNFLVTFGGSLAGTAQPLMTTTAAGGASSVVTRERAGGAGALHNVTGNNTYTGSVTLQSNTYVGADPGTGLTLSGVVQDPTPAPVPAASLTKVGLGTVTFPTANTYTGLTFVNQGVLNIQNAAALGIPVNETQAIQVNGPLTGTFTLNFEGQTTPILPATVPASGGTGNLASLQNALNSLSTIGGVGGSVTVTKSGSVYTVTFGGTLGNTNLPQITGQGFGNTSLIITTVKDGSEGTTVASGATLQLQGGINVSTERLTLNGAGFNNAGALENVSGSTDAWAQPITLGSNSSIGVDGAGDTLTTNQPIGDNGHGYALTKVGPGTLDNQGADTYTGLTTVDQGTLLLDDSTGQSLAGNLTVGQGLSGNSAVARWMHSNQMPAGGFATVLSDGLLDLNGWSQTLLAGLSVFDGQVTTGSVGYGQLTLGGLNITGGIVTAATPTGSVILMGGVAGGADAAGAPATINGLGTLSLDGATRTFNVNGPSFASPAVADMVIDAVISGGASMAGLTKTGPGTLQLNAAETYQGTTTITRGTLLADGTLVGPVTLNGGTLAGDGSVLSVTTSANGGTIQPVNGATNPTTLTTTTTAAQSFTSATTLSLLLNQATPGSYSALALNGDVTLGNASLAGFASTNIHPTDQFTILTTTGTVHGQFASAGTDSNGDTYVYISGQKFDVIYTSDSVTLERVLAPVTFTLSSSANPSVYGQVVTVTATVAPQDAGAGSIPATDTITFSLDGSLTTDPVTLTPVSGTNKEVATFVPSVFYNAPLSVATHTISAIFSGDNTFAGTNPAAPVTLQQVVKKASTSAALTTGATAITGTFTLDPAAVGDPGGTTGRITRTDGHTWGGSGYAAGQEVSLTGSIIGQYVVTGTANAGATLLVESTGAAFTHLAGVALNVSGDFIPSDPITVTATIQAVSPGAGVPSGPVTFTLDGLAPSGATLPNGTAVPSSGPTAGQVTLGPNGQALIVLHNVPVGQHTVKVAYAGDGNFLAVATPATLPVTVTKGVAAIGLAASPPSSSYGENVAFTVTLSGPLTPTGTVSLYHDSTAAANLIGSPTSVNPATGQVTISSAALAAGPHTIYVAYAGNTSYTADSATYSYTVAQAGTQTTLTSSAGTTAYGQPLTLTASVGVVAPGAGAPVGQVTFYDVTGATPVQVGSPVSVNGSGVAQLVVSSLGIGVHDIQAKFGGSANFAASPSNVVVQTVHAGVLVIPSLVGSTTGTAVYGQTLSLTATVRSTAPGGGPPNGEMVTFTDLSNGSKVLGSVPLVSGVATLPGLTGFTVGSHNIQASYAGDLGNTPPGNFLPGTGTFTLTVNADSTTTKVTSSAPNPANPPIYGTDVTYTVSVTANAPGSGTPTGTVVLYDGPVANGKVLGSNTLTGGSTTIDTTLLSAGTHTVYAAYNYNGSDTNFAQSFGTVSQTVKQDGSATTLSYSTNPAPAANSAYYSVPVTLSATVTAHLNGKGVTSGTVTFTDGGQAIAAPVNVVNGVATLTFNTVQSNYVLRIGNHTLSAIYNGSTNFTGSNSAAIPPLAITSDTTNTTESTSAEPAYVGQTATFSATVGAANGGTATPAGSVTFYDGATPIGTVGLTAGKASVTYTFVLADFGHGATAPTFSATYHPAVNSPATTPPTNFLTSTGQVPQQDVLYNDTVSLTSSATSPVTYGAPFTLTATITAVNLKVGSTTVTPTGNIQGTVNFYDTFGGTKTLLGSVIVPATPGVSTTTAQLGIASPTPLLAGSATAHSLTAEFVADPASDFIGVPTVSPALSLTVKADGTTTTLSDTLTLSPDSNFYYGMPATITATVAPAAPGAATPTGTVTFYDTINGKKVQLGTPQTLDVNGQATVSGSALGPGTHSITAVYAGNGNFTTSQASGTGAVGVTVLAALTGTTLLATPADASPAVNTTSDTYGQAITFVATVTTVAGFGGGAPVGTVTFVADGSAGAAYPKQTLGTATLVSSGPNSATATFVYSLLGATSGTPHDVTATFQAPTSAPNYATSTTAPAGDWFVNVAQATPTVTMTASASPVYVNEPITYTATVVPPFAGVPTGSVAFTVDGSLTAFATVALNSQGVAVSPAVTFATAGGHSVTATYVPDAAANFTTTDPFTLNFNVNAQTLASLSAPQTLNNEPVGQLFSFNVAALDTGGNLDYSPGGPVSVTVLSSPKNSKVTGPDGTANSLTFNFVNGVATVQMSVNMVGTYKIELDGPNGLIADVTINTQGSGGRQT